MHPDLDEQIKAEWAVIEARMKRSIAREKIALAFGLGLMLGVIITRLANGLPL